MLHRILASTLLVVGCAGGGGPLVVGEAAPGFALPDVNPASPRFGDEVGPSDYEGQLSVWYFGHANCPYCSSQFGVLDALQDELAAEAVAADIVGLNAEGLEQHNALITEGRDLPWLQDSPAAGVWADWGAEWRDIFVVDAAGTVIDKRNLTDFDLRDEANLDVYRALLRGE